MREEVIEMVQQLESIFECTHCTYILLNELEILKCLNLKMQKYLLQVDMKGSHMHMERIAYFDLTNSTI